MKSFHRRSFLRNTAALWGAGILSAFSTASWSRSLEKALHSVQDLDPSTLATEEDFWHYVRQSFTPSTAIINLNNGGVSPAPISVQEAMKRYYDMSNEAPSYYMWRILDQGRENLRTNLAAMAGCGSDEIAINRNSSEGLETVIFGLRLQRGDEVVLSKQDYPNIINAWKQREHRDGIKLVWVDLPLPSENEIELASPYIKAFTSATRVVNITHVINWNGQIMPVARITEAARKKGIQTVVDGAHSFAHFPFRIVDLNADYYATSLHKWLYAPIGTGMLYVRRERIKELYPMFAAGDPESADIRKFEHLGTRPFYIEQAIQKAIEFNEMIGLERKAYRLAFLKNYWMEKVSDLPGIKFHTSRNQRWACAIGLVSFENKPSADLDRSLFTKQRVHVTTVDFGGIKGVRITPNVYTSIQELDMLVKGIREFATA